MKIENRIEKLFGFDLKKYLLGLAWDFESFQLNFKGFVRK